MGSLGSSHPEVVILGMIDFASGSIRYFDEEGKDKDGAGAESMGELALRI
jgi:hypothetical protein